MNPEHVTIRNARTGLLFLGILVAQVGRAQIITTDSDRQLLTSARAAALGDAYVSEVSDPGVLYWNPGALSFLDNSAIAIDHFHESNTGLMNEIITVPFQMGNVGSFAFGTTLSHLGVIKAGQSYDAPVLQYGVDAGYSTLVVSGLSLGVRVGARSGRSGDTYLFAGSWTVGLSYYPSAEISYGLTYGEIGEGMYFVPPSAFTRGKLPRRLQIGMSMRYPSSKAHRIMVLSVANEKIMEETGLLYKIGLELYPVQILAVRLGYVTGLGISGPRFGAGINTRMFKLDYAVSQGAYNMNFQQFTVAVTLN